MNYAEYVKSQVTESDWEVIQKLGIDLDCSWGELAKDFVNAPKRRKRELPFLQSILQAYEEPKIFDACLGTGATTIGLKFLGYDLVSNEVDSDLEKIAREEAAKIGESLAVTHYDWRDPKLREEKREQFDIVLCLGNSLTYLFKKEDQLKALRNFRDILKPKGRLLIDTRFYERFMYPKDIFPESEFKFSGEIVYCGKDKVSVKPVHTSPTMVVLEYHHKEKGITRHLPVYPFKTNEIHDLIEEAGFNVRHVYADYGWAIPGRNAEFITYEAKKEQLSSQ